MGWFCLYQNTLSHSEKFSFIRVFAFWPKLTEMIARCKCDQKMRQPVKGFQNRYTDIWLADMMNDTTVFCKWISLNSLNSMNLQLQTTADRYLSRGSDKKFIFITSPGIIVTARHRAYLVIIQFLHFKVCHDSLNSVEII